MKEYPQTLWNLLNCTTTNTYLSDWTKLFQCNLYQLYLPLLFQLEWLDVGRELK